MQDRVAWVDYAKGLCIVMVVMMHATLGVEKAAGEAGFMHAVVEFARPFRMPDFFLISGLFLSRVIDRPWRDYLDRKVVHFAYFYGLWFLIQGAFKWPGLAAEQGLGAVPLALAMGLVEPFGTLWFIYLLPVFFVLTKALRGVSPVLVWGVAALLEATPVETGSIVIDEFAARYVYFLTGYYAAPLVFALAERVRMRPRAALAGLAGWALVNGAAVTTSVAALPGVSLGLGLVGAAAVVAVAALLAEVRWLGGLRHAGENSIVVYLAFFLPMAVTRTVLLKTGVIQDVGLISVVVTAVAVIVPLVLYRLVRGTALSFLFERPKALRLGPATRPQPA